MAGAGRRPAMHTRSLSCPLPHTHTPRRRQASATTAAAARPDGWRRPAHAQRTLLRKPARLRPTKKYAKQMSKTKMRIFIDINTSAKNIITRKNSNTAYISQQYAHYERSYAEYAIFLKFPQ
jgi:hypothetical protein